MAETTVPMDDKELMAEALTPEPVETPAEPAPEPEKQERERDDKGRFVAKETEEPAPEAPAETPAPEIKDEAHVPSWRLREVREAREAAERRAEEAGREAYAVRQQMQDMQRQLAQLQKPKPEPVDFFQNPDEALAQRLSPIEERFAAMESRLRLNTSRAMAVAMHGVQAVKDMETAVEKASRSGSNEMSLLSAQMRASDDPVEVAMQWYKRSSLLEKTGGDLDAYVQQQLDAKLKDPKFLAQAMEAARAQAGQVSTPSIKLPPSINRAAGGGHESSPSGDMTDANLYAYATSK